MKKEVDIRIRMTKEQKELIEFNAKKHNFSSISEYIRVLALNDTFGVKSGK